MITVRSGVGFAFVVVVNFRQIIFLLFDIHFFVCSCCVSFPRILQTNHIAAENSIFGCPLECFVLILLLLEECVEVWTACLGLENESAPSYSSSSVTYSGSLTLAIVKIVAISSIAALLIIFFSTSPSFSSNHQSCASNFCPGAFIAPCLSVFSLCQSRIASADSRGSERSFEFSCSFLEVFNIRV